MSEGKKQPRCPACAAQQSGLLGEKNGIELNVCRACGTLYVRGVAASDRFDYDGYYQESNLTVPGFVGRRLDEIFAGFARFRQGNRLLDVGCGAGTLLHAARRAGWDAEGSEVSRPAAEHVRSEGFRVFCGELAAADFPDGHFDVVTASEVLEHVPDPRALLGEVARVLRPGGLFWGTTPHGRGLSARALGLRWSTVCPPEHLQLFSLRGVRRMLRAAGFRRADVAARSFNPFEFWNCVRGAGAEAAGRPAPGKEVAPPPAGGEGFDRVATAYSLNERMTKTAAARAAKATVNFALGVTGLGDSIIIRAEK